MISTKFLNRETPLILSNYFFTLFKILHFQFQFNFSFNNKFSFFPQKT